MGCWTRGVFGDVPYDALISRTPDSEGVLDRITFSLLSMYNSTIYQEKFISKAHGDPINGGLQPFDLSASKPGLTKFSAQEKNTNIAKSSGRKKIQAASWAPIKHRWVISTITCHCADTRKAAITALSRHPGDHIRVCSPRRVTSPRGPGCTALLIR